MRILIDTNVFLRIRDAGNPQHDECVAAVDVLRASHSPCVSSQVLAEFWVVATRPRDVNGMGLSVASAALHISQISSAFPCLIETSDTASHWLRIVTEYSVMGRQAHDARLVALMLSHGITHILTLNPSDFARYPEVTTLTPRDLVAE